MNRTVRRTLAALVLAALPVVALTGCNVEGRHHVWQCPGTVASCVTR